MLSSWCQNHNFMPVLCTIYLALIWDYTRIAKWRSLYPKNHYLPSINRGNSCFSYIFGYNVYSYANIIIGKNINVLLYKISNMLKASWILILQTEIQNIFSIYTWKIQIYHGLQLISMIFLYPVNTDRNF